MVPNERPRISLQTFLFLAEGGTVEKKCIWNATLNFISDGPELLKVIDVAKLLGYGFNKEAPLLPTEPSGLMDGYDKQRHEKRASMASPVNFDVQYDEKRDDGECECQTPRN